MVLTAIVIFLVSLVSRALISIKVAPGSDVYGHLYFANALKQQRGGPFCDLTLKVVGCSGVSMPLMWHWIIGFFSIKSLLRHQAWLNGVIDSLFVVMVFLFAHWSGFSEREALYAVGLYLLTPMWFSSISIGPRIAGFTPRLSSEVITNLFFMVCLLPIGLSNLQITVIAGMLAAFVLSSSKFGVQALLLLTPLTSLFSFSLIPLISLTTGFAIVITASRGRFFNQVVTQMRHLIWYCKENLKGNMPVSDRNSFRLLFKRSEPNLMKHLLKFIYRAASLNSYTSVLIKLPALLLVFFAVVESTAIGSGIYSPVLVAPTAAACLVYFIVNIRPFLFLGEAERYLNHVAFFIAIFAAHYALINDSDWLLWGLFAYGAIYWVIEAFILERLKPHSHRERAFEDARVIEDLQTLIKPTVVLAYPYHSGGGVFRIMLETVHQTIFCFMTNKAFTENFNAKYADEYPYVKLDRLDEMADEYDIGYIVIDRRKLLSRGLEAWSPSSRWEQRPVGGNIYDVYHRSEIKGNPAVDLRKSTGTRQM